MSTSSISPTNQYKYVVPIEELSVTSRVGRAATRWFQAAGDASISLWDRTRTNSVPSGVNASWQNGRQLSNAAMNAAIDQLHAQYDENIKILKGIVGLDVNIPTTTQVIKEGLDLEITAEIKDTVPTIVAVPVRINGGSHIGLLAFDTRTGACVWYDARTSTPGTAKVMNTDLTVEALATHIWQQIPKKTPLTAPRLRISTNRSKDQHDFFNCGIHVIKAMEDLAKNPNLFRMVERAHNRQDIGINAIRHLLAEKVAPTSASSTSGTSSGESGQDFDVEDDDFASL